MTTNRLPTALPAPPHLIQQTIVAAPGPSDRTITMPDGQIIQVPDHWALLMPGDAGLTRRVKAAGPTWTMQTKRGRKIFSQGLWAPASHIDSARQKLEVERSTDAYANRKAADAKRREVKQENYVTEFYVAVISFLRFAPAYKDLAERLAAAVSAHATPVGSGTVARTERIPVQQRAEAAVIAWMRHQTTLYDHMKIARVKGLRREVRAELAESSRKLLQRYRNGEPVNAETCPLQQALRNPNQSADMEQIGSS